MSQSLEVEQSNALDRALASCAAYPKRPGQILTEIIYEAWCEVCDEPLGERRNYQEASIALTAHLDEKHKGWETSRAAFRARALDSSSSSALSLILKNPDEDSEEAVEEETP